MASTKCILLDFIVHAFARRARPPLQDENLAYCEAVRENCQPSQLSVHANSHYEMLHDIAKEPCGLKTAFYLMMQQMILREKNHRPQTVLYYFILVAHYFEFTVPMCHWTSFKPDPTFIYTVAKIIDMNINYPGGLENMWPDILQWCNQEHEEDDQDYIPDTDQLQQQQQQ